MSAHVPLGEQLEMGPRPLNAGRGFAPRDAFVARHQQGTPSTSSLGHVLPAPKYISGRGGQAALKNGDLAPVLHRDDPQQQDGRELHSHLVLGSGAVPLLPSSPTGRPWGPTKGAPGGPETDILEGLIAAAVTNHANPPHARAPTPLTHPAAEDVSLHDAHRRKICSP